MNDAEAAQQLQTIRNLMERAALYRRALGPVLLAVGFIALGGTALGGIFAIDTTAGFLRLWLSVAGLAVSTSFLMIRKQALGMKEPFWTPPTRRVVGAMLPPLLAGVALTIAVAVVRPELPATSLPYAWSACYGLALHAAGFFTLKGIRQVGWAFFLFGAAYGLTAMKPDAERPFLHAHLQMGVMFGLVHLGAAGKLLLQEKNSAA
jgi:hypothetical protein